jgi:hypothetical protein
MSWSKLCQGNILKPHSTSTGLAFGGGGKEINTTIKLDTVFTDPTNSVRTKFTKPTLGRQTGKGHQKNFRQKALPMETSPYRQTVDDIGENMHTIGTCIIKQSGAHPGVQDWALLPHDVGEQPLT